MEKIYCYYGIKNFFCAVVSGNKLDLTSNNARNGNMIRKIRQAICVETLQ